MSIWSYQRSLTERLIRWSLVSFSLGALLSRRRFWRGMGKQVLGWAAADLGIAYFRTRVAEPGYAALPDSDTALEPETRRLLWLNPVLDLLYIAGGRWLSRRGSRGVGLGMVVQGAFLLIFDLYHAPSLPDRVVSEPLSYERANLNESSR